jgi:hypothetical protein
MLRYNVLDSILKLIESERYSAEIVRIAQCNIVRERGPEDALKTCSERADRIHERRAITDQ